VRHFGWSVGHPTYINGKVLVRTHTDFESWFEVMEALTWAVFGGNPGGRRANAALPQARSAYYIPCLNVPYCSDSVLNPK
jgi:hypothetical protein